MKGLPMRGQRAAKNKMMKEVSKKTPAAKTMMGDKMMAMKEKMMAKKKK